MSIRDTTRVRGSIFSTTALGTLSATNCNVLFVSDRSLYLMQTFAQNEVNFLARYAKSFQAGGYYTPVDLSDTADVDLVRDVARNYRLEVFDMSCDLVAAIDRLGVNIAQGGSGCGCEIGTDVDTDDGEIGGSLPDPVGGVAYEASDPISDRRCLAANYIHQFIRDIVQQLEDNRVDGYALLGLRLVLTIVGAILGSLLGPAGALVGAVAGATLAMSLELFKITFDLTLLLSSITDNETGAVCALYSSSSSSEARTAYLAHLTGEGATSFEIAFVTHLLPNNLLNLLFFAWGDSEDAIGNTTPEVDCDDCTDYYKIDTYGTGTDLDVTWAFDRVDIFGGATVNVWIATSANDPTRNAHWIRTRAYSPVSGFSNPVCSKYVKIVFSGTYDAGTPSGGDKWGYTVCLGSPVTGQPPLDTNLDRWYWASGLNTAFTAEVWISEVDGTPI